MYLIGQGHEHLGPGTSMVQRINWTQDQERQLMNSVRGRGPGLGCASCQGMCGKCGGLGLFDSGMDFTTWGLPEWALVGVGIYAGLSLIGDTKRGVARSRRVGKAVRKAV